MTNLYYHRCSEEVADWRATLHDAARNFMLVATHVPQPPLDQFVAFFWFYEGLTFDHALERVLPDGGSELIINLRDEPRHVFDQATHRPRASYRGSWLSGPQAKSIIIDTAPDSSMIGAHFKAGGMSAFLGLPANELRDRVISLEEVWSGDARTLRARLLEAPNAAGKFGILENALRARWRGVSHHRAVRYAIERFTDASCPATVAQVTSDIGLSARRFIEVFNEQVGLTPKLFCRVQRFQRVLGEIHGPREIDWAEIAAGCGYFDQAHLIHDFKEFCGLRPGDYLDLDPAAPNFIPIRG